MFWILLWLGGLRLTTARPDCRFCVRWLSQESYPPVDRVLVSYLRTLRRAVGASTNTLTSRIRSTCEASYLCCECSLHELPVANTISGAMVKGSLSTICPASGPGTIRADPDALCVRRWRSPYVSVLCTLISQTEYAMQDNSGETEMHNAKA
jgi:hypothetical protein